MQELSLKQDLTHKLSKQQIQFVKLLQMPVAALNDYIHEEMTKNPMLEGDQMAESDETETAYTPADLYPELNILSYRAYRTPLQGYNGWIPHVMSLHEMLDEQLTLEKLSNKAYTIGKQLLGSLDKDGYLACDLSVVVKDLAATQAMDCSLQEVEEVLSVVQNFDPPGIAARNLQECLLIQLKRQGLDDPSVGLAYRVVQECFESLTKKHYAAIAKKLGISDFTYFKEVIGRIARLNPKPGHSYEDNAQDHAFLTPEFLIVEQEGRLVVELVKPQTYRVHLNKKYLGLLKDYEKLAVHDGQHRKMVEFLKKKYEDAKWVLDTLSKRSQVLLDTMRVILSWQYDFFISGEDPNKLVPMVLKNIADHIGLDVSTVSRIVNQKSVQARFGIYPLKFFFSSAVGCYNGEDVSNKVIKNRILELIDQEDKTKPYTDESLVSLLVQEGYHVARRTVTKYREQLNLPVARLRKSFA